MTSYSPRMRELLGYVDTDGDGVTDTPPTSGAGGSEVDLSSYAKKTEVAAKADKAALEAKADKTEVAAKADKTALEAKADKTALEAKADKTELTAYAKTTALAAKADKTYVDTKVAQAATGGPVDLSSYALKSAVDAKADATALAAKADKTYVDTELAKKANSASLGAKADRAYVDEELAKKSDKATPTVTGMTVQGGNLVLTYSNGFVDTLTLPATGSAPVESNTPLIVPLSLNAGQQDSWASGNAQLGREFVMPMKWGAPVSRFKVHVRHINPRTGTAGDDIPVTIKGVGKNASGVLSEEKSIEVSGTAKGSEDFTTDWIDYPLAAGTEYGIRMTYTGSSSARILLNAGGSWVTSVPSSIWAYNASPFHIWVEAETPSSTKIYTFAGDSLTVGIGATLPVFDSWAYQLSRTQGVLPVMYAASGSTFDEWIDGTNPYRLTLWDDERFAKGDVLFENMGSNNVFVGNSLSAMKSKAKSYTATMKNRVKSGAPVVTTAILPRNSKPASDATETNRLEYNTWLSGLPADIGAKKHVDFISVVSSDNDNIPTEKTPDGTHLTTPTYTDISVSANAQWSKSEIAPATFVG